MTLKPFAILKQIFDKPTCLPQVILADDIPQLVHEWQFTFKAQQFRHAVYE